MKKLQKTTLVFIISILFSLLLSACTNTNTNGPSDKPDGPFISSSPQATGIPVTNQLTETPSAAPTNAPTPSAAPTPTPTLTPTPIPTFTPTPTPTVTPVLITSLSSEKVLFTNRDVFGDYYLKPDQKTSIPVIYIGFSDGIPYDEAAIKDIFTGDYGPDECLYSVSSYYRENTHRDLFDFHFFYWESPMTCEQCWHLVNDEDANGFFYGNQFLLDVYEDLKQKYSSEFNALDTDKDGIIDAAIFIVGSPGLHVDPEYPDNEYLIYGAATSFKASSKTPKAGDPVLKNFVKISYPTIERPLEPGNGPSAYTRTLIHEIGHLYGLKDLYDFYSYNNTFLSTLGEFDMYCNETGDLNPFLKMTCGWASPTVITPDIEDINIKLSSTSLTSDVVLIPTSQNWNHTAFDEYILIDLMTPDCANGYEWPSLLDLEERYSYEPGSKVRPETFNGGIRIYHVDARLLKENLNDSTITKVDDIADAVESIKDHSSRLKYAYYTSNGLNPVLPGDSRFHHLIDLIPSDGSSKYLMNDNPPSNWAAYSPFRPSDLFITGDTFSIESCAKAFPDAPLMNNGEKLNYSVTVLSYDPINKEAVINIKKQP